MTRHAQLIATGSYRPAIEVTNDDLRARFPEHREFIDKMEQSTGIRSRWHAPEDWATSDLALHASRQALERAGRRPEDVDLILLGTDSPDYITPATSVVLQHKLGAVNAGTFDIGCACASFPTGIATAAGWLAANPSMRTVLVVGAYLMHKLADPDDPMIFFYGDGAAAAVLEPGDEPGFLAAAVQADGSYHRHWGIFAGGTAEPANLDAVREGRTRVRMLERYPPEVNREGWQRLVRRLAADAGFALDEIALVIFTQVRKPTIEEVMGDLGLPMSRTHTIMEHTGYTGSACIGMALHDALETRSLAPGDLVVLIGSGVGYNQAGVALRLRETFRGGRR
ncbi:MAG: ketoacyl-ACP synthase III [Acidobacteria bacterium]|nr:MAG: ketoacyl-ACP synthase III [Acidobacteriota bacterium]